MKVWANDIPMTDEEQRHIVLLREAGCKCKIPLLGYIPGVGPRCRMCQVEVDDESAEVKYGLNLLKQEEN